MPESRERLARPVDISSLLPNAARRVNLMVDEPGLSSGLIGTTFRHGSQPDPGPGRGSPLGRGNGSPASGFGSVRRFRRSPIGRGSVGRRTVGRGRGWVRPRTSALPSWYPRTPLRDISAVARAIERRRAQLNDAADATLVPQQQSDANTSSAQLEHGIHLSTPLPTTVKGGKPKPAPGSQVWKLMARIADENGEGECSTPERKLLNSIEKVREVWLDEQRKIESTPSAKKADREKKVRTLMSMR
ncbi:negative regulation of ubiquitin-protein transferase activity [Dionaea muscipula]